MDEQENERVNFTIATDTIMERTDINFGDKAVLSRILSYERFFESVETTAKKLGTTPLVVQRAKRKLLKMGFIEVVENTGRGLVYRAANGKIWKSKGATDKKVRTDVTKKSYQSLQKSHTYYTDKIQRKDNKGADAPAEKEKEKANEPKTYGNQQVNEFLQAWKEETGDDFSKDTRERRATWNLIKGKTSEATKALLTAVGEARRSGDRFAPQIASPSDLVGKYSKINKLRLWVMRNEENEEPHPPYWSWQKLPPQDDLTDEERAATQRAFKEARASGKYKWLKPKEENDAE